MKQFLSSFPNASKFAMPFKAMSAMCIFGSAEILRDPSGFWGSHGVPGLTGEWTPWRHCLQDYWFNFDLLLVARLSCPSSGWVKKPTTYCGYCGWKKSCATLNG